METDDALPVPSAGSPINEGGNDKVDDSACGTGIVDLQSVEVEVEEDEANAEIPQSSDDTMDGDKPSTDNGNYMDDNSTALEVRFQLDESVVVMKEKTCFSETIHSENGCATVQDESGTDCRKQDEGLVGCQETRASSLSGSKRPRENDEEEASVQIIYKSLTGDSRKKLGEFLQQWSQWHAKHCSSGIDSGEAFESGEEIYFPALQVGTDKTSTVSFWLDNETRKKGKKDIISFDGNSVPVYDRGYSLALTSVDGSKNPEGVMEINEASRCFNCGSFNHALKDCPQPRDNVAVNNARKQHKAKRNQSPGSRNSSRYYQESVGGKYDGLRPGSLDAETRKMLGLGVFDPPPWLNRMREIGYPPGYMDEDEDMPSGITIFDDEEKKEDTEEGEIAESICPELPKKMSVEFPGVNAPIPEWADESRWDAGGTSDLHMFRDRSYGRYNRSSDTITRGYNHEHRWSREFGDDETRGHHQEQRRSSDFGDDEPPPPGCMSESPSLSSQSRRYGGYDSSYNPRDAPSTPWSSSFERSFSERSRRSSLVYDDSPSHRSYGHLSSSSPR